MILSICIPTYNRGKRALDLVKKLKVIAEKYEGKIELVVSNNGSTIEEEYYAKICEISSEYVIYHRFNQNVQYVGNYNQVIKMSRGKFCLLLSDEDSINEVALDYYLELITNNPDLGLIKTGTSINYVFQEEEFLAPGMSAVNGYYLVGNYISGIIYNRSVLTDEIIDKLYESYFENSTNRAYYWYPHLFVETYIMLTSRICKCPKLLVIEGRPEQDQEKDISTNILTYATYEDRIKQARGLVDYISDLLINDGLKLKMVILTIEKTFNLVSFQRNKYESIGVNCYELIRNTSDGLKNVIENCAIPVIVGNMDMVEEYIDAVKLSYMKEWANI